MADPDQARSHRRSLILVSTVALLLALSESPLKVSWSGLELTGTVIWIALAIAQVYFLLAYWTSPYRLKERERPKSTDNYDGRLRSINLRILSEEFLWEMLPFLLAVIGLCACLVGLVVQECHLFDWAIVDCSTVKPR